MKKHNRLFGFLLDALLVACSSRVDAPKGYVET